MTDEIKSLVGKIEKGLEDFKQTNDERLAKLEKGQSSSDFEAKLAKIQADIASAMDAKKDIEALEAKFNVQQIATSSKETNKDKLAHKEAFFNNFVRKGNESGLRELEQKAWQIGVGSDGGFAVPEQIDRAIEQLARDLSPMRQVANVVQVGTSDYKKLVNVNGIASGWVGETAARPSTNTSSLAEVTFPMGELYANPQVTQQSLDDMFFNVESEIGTQLAEEFAIAEGAAFITGNGTNRPKGITTYTTAATADATRAFATIEHIATGVAGDFAATNKADVLYDVIAKLKAAYRGNANWMMNKALMFELLKIKDTTGQYLWQPSLQEGFPIRLLGFGVVEAEDMPVKAANALGIAFGDFRRAYTIVDRVGTRMLRDPYSNKPYVGFYTTKRVGGGLVNSEAVKFVKFSAT
jgi:HK97 family phage major capsid protein